MSAETATLACPSLVSQAGVVTLRRQVRKHARKAQRRAHSESRDRLCDLRDYAVHGIPRGQNTGVGSLSLLQGIVPTQGSVGSFPAEPPGKPKNTGGGGQPFPPPGDCPDSGIEPGSPALQADSLPTELSGKS